MKILVTDSAKEDLKSIQEYYRELDIPDIANKQISEILEKAEHLIDHPESGRIVPEFNDIQIRELISPPYRVVYLLTDHAIQIIRVWRSERTLELPTT
jgi:toxin ParE1/3/4